MPDVHHETVHFSGHVQGVGFRHAVMQVAREFEVAGFVRNLADGRVEVQAEGVSAEIGRFVDAIGERMHGHVRKVERTGARRPAQFQGFIIR